MGQKLTGQRPQICLSSDRCRVFLGQAASTDLYHLLTDAEFFKDRLWDFLSQDDTAGRSAAEVVESLAEYLLLSSTLAEELRQTAGRRL